VIEAGFWMRMEFIPLVSRAMILATAIAAISKAMAQAPVQLKVDHATVCGPDLEPMRHAFAAAGLVTDYGGPHASVTHMALLGFEDGSYLELIAPQKPGVVEGSAWAKMMAGDAGTCAWAVGTADIKSEAERLKQAGTEVAGPFPGSHKKPDSTVIAWETARVGSGTQGATLPFIIEDKTPRNLRVQPSASLKRTGLTGIGVVVLGVKDLDAAIAVFRKAYGWEAPTLEEHKEFGAMACFPGTPVMLAAPLDKNSWLADRLNKVGESPVAYLLATPDLSVAAKRFNLTQGSPWFHRDLAWFDAKKLNGVKLGVVK
jgi:hypothetical protein